MWKGFCELLAHSGRAVMRSHSVPDLDCSSHLQCLVESGGGELIPQGLKEIMLSGTCGDREPLKQILPAQSQPELLENHVDS
jgi:hypothetical protein